MKPLKPGDYYQETYSDYQEVDYNAPYALFKVKQHIQVEDDTALWLKNFHKDDRIRTEANRPIKHIQSLSFNHTARQVSNSGDNSRNTIYYGSIKSLGENSVMLWGFPTWHEGKSHILMEDKENLNFVHDMVTTTLRLSHIPDLKSRLKFWIAKNQSSTRMGCWAISVDGIIISDDLETAKEDADLRTYLLYAQQDFKVYQRAMAVQNQIKLNG